MEAAQMTEAAPGAERPAHSLLMERMLFFSDAVFAIVLTLLALDLRLPPRTDDAHLFVSVEAIGGSVTAFAVSFALVGVFWLGHLATLRALATFDWTVAAVNVVFLFTVTLTPFAAALVGRFGMQGEAWRFYCITMIAISLAAVSLIAVSRRDEARLVVPEHQGRFWFRLWRAATPGLAFAAGLALSLAGLHTLASVCWLLVPPILLALRLWFHQGGAPSPTKDAAPRRPAG
jgi:uncharacterized membrane protein